MARKIVEFTSRSSHRMWDGRSRERTLYAGIEDHRMGDIWVTIRDKNDKMVFTCTLAEWSEVMFLFNEAVVEVTGETLKGFGQ